MKKIIYYTAIACLAAFLTGCAAPAPMAPARVMTAADYAAAVSETRDNFEKKTSYRAPNYVRSGYDAVLLRAWRVDGAPMSYQLYVSDHYENRWRFYDAAYDSDGKQLNMTQISREVASCRNGCSYFETVGLNVDRAYLEAAAKSGMQFKLRGKGGEEFFYVSGEYIQGFLMATPK